MKKQRFDDHVNINVYPESINQLDENSPIELTIGDMHGNTLKYVYFLIKHGVMEMEKADYQKLVEIYTDFATYDFYQNDAITINNRLNEFRAIISKTKINQGAKIRLIGDEMCDRGANDYLSLLVMYKLHQESVEQEILMSNHSIEFHEAYEKVQRGESDTFKAPRLIMDHADSLNGLQKLIDKKVVSNQDIVNLVDTCYKRNVKAIGYTLDEENNSIIFHAHAGIGLDVIKYAADYLEVKHDDSTAKTLAETIDCINNKVAEHIENNMLCTKLVAGWVLNEGYNQMLIDPKKYPLEFMMWNRDYTNLLRPQEHNGITLGFTHGHDANDVMADTEENPHIYNLDSQLGKKLLIHEGNLSVLQTPWDGVKTNVNDFDKDEEAEDLLAQRKIGSAFNHSAFFKNHPGATIAIVGAIIGGVILAATIPTGGLVLPLALGVGLGIAALAIIIGLITGLVKNAMDKPRQSDQYHPIGV